MKKLWLHFWRGYGYCNTCNAHDREPCKWWLGRFPTRGWFRRLLPHKGRESYEHFLDRYAIILSEHHGYTILPSEVYKYENGEMTNGYDAKR